MKKLFSSILLVQLVAAACLTASAADVTEAELMQAATALRFRPGGRPFTHSTR